MGLTIFNALSFVPHILFIVVFIVALFQIETKDMSRKEKNQEYLKKYVNWIVGIAPFIYGTGHLLFPSKVAKSIGWPENNPFQKEVAFANLSYGITAQYIMSSDMSIDAYKSLAVSYLAWLGGCLLVHIYDLIEKNNFSFNNIVAAPLFSVLNIIIVSIILQNC
jgi:hypothetical protein